MKNYQFEAGDTVILEGDRINGYAHEWTLVVGSVNWNDWDSEFEEAPDMVFTNGYCFSGDTLYSKVGGGKRLGRFFSAFTKEVTAWINDEMFQADFEIQKTVSKILAE